MAVAGDSLDVPVEEPFLLRSGPEFVETVTLESTISGNLSATMYVFDVGVSAGETPFTSPEAEGS